MHVHVLPCKKMLDFADSKTEIGFHHLDSHILIMPVEGLVVTAFSLFTRAVGIKSQLVT